MKKVEPFELDRVGIRISDIKNWTIQIMYKSIIQKVSFSVAQEQQTGSDNRPFEITNFTLIMVWYSGNLKSVVQNPDFLKVRFQMVR